MVSKWTTAPNLRGRFQLSRLPLEIARWLVLATLTSAPLAYGCTRDWAKRDLAYGLVGISGIGVIGMLIQRRWPRCSWFMVVPMILLLVQGWGMALNAAKMFDPVSFTFYNVLKLVECFPGAVDRATVGHQMLLVSGLMGCWILATDLAANPIWRWRVWMTICLSGVCVVVLGLAQRVSVAKGIFWNEEAAFAGNFFGPYRYHANAGAFINLVLPFMLGAANEVFREARNNTWKASLVIGILITSAAAFVNASRAAMSITVLLIIANVVFTWRSLKTRRYQIDTGVAGGGIVLILAAIAGLAWAVGMDASMRKWTDGGSIFQSDRYIISALLIQKMIPAAGLWGFGAGTFSITFPFFTNDVGGMLAGFWKYAHEDYLQTIIEWGYIGATLWAYLVFRGLVRGLRKLTHASLGDRRTKRGDKDGSTLLACCCFSICGVLLHASVDFPLQIPSLQLYMAVILGLTWGMACPPQIDKGSETEDANRKLPEYFFPL